MGDTIWDGITRSATLRPEAAAQRHQLADAAKAYNWNSVLSLLAQNPELVNVTRPDGQSLYTSLHQAAHGGAPEQVVNRLVELGAWRTLRTAQDERAVDIARRKGHGALVPLLEPTLRRTVALEALQAIQRHLHALVVERAGASVQEHALRLPELEPLLELDKPKYYFAIPGMCGGFAYRLETVADDPVLITESWSRVVEGSGQRHLVSPHGSLLLAQGFI